MEIKINPTYFNKDRKKRKNAGLVRKILQEFKDKKFINPGDSFASSIVAKVIKDNPDVLSKWILDPEAKDGFGLDRTVGDIIGVKVLDLKRASVRRFVMPDELPVMDGDMVVSPAVYNEFKPYVAKVKCVTGVFGVSIDFDGVPYRYISSNFDDVLNVLNPVACDVKGVALSKNDVRMLLDGASKNDCMVMLNPSIYQKLYGAHSPGKSVFQRVV